MEANMKDISKHEKDCDCARCIWDKIGGNILPQPTRLMVSSKQYDLIKEHGFLEGMIRSFKPNKK